MRITHSHFTTTTAAVVLLAVVSAASIASFSAATLDYSRVHLVDQANGNFLFRGNMPVNDTSFAYDQLVAMMAERAQAAGVEIPNEFYLVDLSLSNSFDKGFALEQAFWANGAHGNLGVFVNWQLGAAGLLPPSSYPLKQAQQMALNGSSVWKVDQLPTRIPLIREMLETGKVPPSVATLPPSAPWGAPLVIYVHCEAGCDRTGEVIGAYRMQYQAANVTGMYALDTAECGRSPNYFSTGALEWFCLYFSETFSQNIGDCEGFATCKPFGKCQPVSGEAASAAAVVPFELPLFERTRPQFEEFARVSRGQQQQRQQQQQQERH